MGDPARVRAESHDAWERAATGWARRSEQLQAYAMPVSRWLVDAIAPQPGQRVLELAAGIGETGFLAAELIAPNGTLVCSDFSERMLEAARERAEELGLLDVVEFKEIELEWIDAPTASFDAILCRWGLMFALDMAAALREMRRALAVGGRLALATWAPAARNPWAALAQGPLAARGLVAAPAPDAPGMFRLQDPDALATLLADAGFAEPRVEEVAIEVVHEDFEAWLAYTNDCSRIVASALATLDPAARAEVEDEIRSAAGPFTEPDGRVRFPGVALCAAAQA